MLAENVEPEEDEDEEAELLLISVRQRSALFRVSPTGRKRDPRRETRGVEERLSGGTQER